MSVPLAASPAADPSEPLRLPDLHQARRDLGAVAIMTVLVFAIASAFEISERMSGWARRFEAYQVDEIPLALVVLLLGLTWYSWRRYRQATAEIRLRMVVEADLARALAENRELVRRSIQVQEDERRHIARELHDEMGQWLNALKLDAVSIRDRAEGEIRGHAENIVELTNHVYDVARNMTRRLRPVALDELGLSSALQYLVDQWKRRHGHVRCNFSTEGPLEDLGETANITLYRCVQECLTNIAKHADARTVDIAVIRPTGQHRVELRVADDGKGFDLAAPRAGLGLLGLRERFEVLGGGFIVGLREGGGLEVQAWIPST